MQVSDNSAAPVTRIAVLRPNHRLGNTLLLTPLIQELETRFPDAQVELVTACSEAHAVFQRFAQVTTEHTFPVKSYHHPARVLALLRSLKGRSFDLAIDPVPRSRAGRFLLGQVRARERIGFHWGVPSRDRMLTHIADPKLAPPHFAHSPLYLLRSAYHRQAQSDTDAGVATLPLDLRLSEAERREGERRLAATLGSAGWPARARLGIFAHASGQKSYPVEWWRQIAACFRSRAAAVQLVEFVPADGRPRLAGEVPGVYTPDLRLLAATLAATSLVVLADGGVMHLAEAAGARVLGLFKTTEPSQYGPSRAMSEALWARDASAESVAARILAVLNSSPGMGAVA